MLPAKMRPNTRSVERKLERTLSGDVSGIGAGTLAPELVNRAALHHPGIELDLAERGLVSGDIMLQDAEQGFCLLWRKVDSLEILDLDLGFGLLLHSSENKEEVPHVDSDLDAVGVVLTIIRGIRQLHVGLSWVGHRDLSVPSFCLPVNGR